MTKKEKHIEFKDKLLKGLEKMYTNLIEYKRQKNSVLVVMKGDKIVKIKP
ncbi:MAG: hypothetical protein HWD63_10445 [Candidatus Parvibacillus calidus]|nr:MAG: hypothetical protein HWD63_10445 [Candidatus Parvibacillus calidus]